ncbi:hypothetical protein FFWV33_02495 [Flavobacterium faecale]|uniref:SD-repeat containing protein B domain-containing protein n=1 Tax=Flavobacterium faecale TaxID=1355330 RepID=A0A2S1L9T1_9FLAO|nr:hypothetical protein [Flavobacterium faecale]AWG20477.1 hypothetical protein FFWV33_02495 [Flavobacterium faecale]
MNKGNLHTSEFTSLYRIIEPILVWMLLVMFLFSFHCAQGQVKGLNIENRSSSFGTYDELRVSVYLENHMSFETDVLIGDNDKLLYNVEDLFKNLEIHTEKSTNGTVLTGFLEKESKTYEIDFSKGIIRVGTAIFRIKDSVTEEFGVRYMDANLIEQAFGIKIIFDQRSLSANLAANFELPFLKQMRIENTRKSILRLQGDQQAVVDTVIGRNYHLLKGATLDWGVNSNQIINGFSNNNILLGVGGELLYGETNVSVNLNDGYPFDNRQLQYSWRWIDNDKRFIKQAHVGKIVNQNIAFLSAPVIGAAITNSPNTVRKARGTYTITDYTDPDWTVELYINNVLVDYTTADASGLYLFKVPIVYGYTTMKLKFYGTQGEERFEERIINTPYTFLPAGIFEYNLTGGFLQDAGQSTYGKGEFNYGVNRFLTIGGGTEYLSSIPDHPYIPFIKTTFQPFSKMILTMQMAQNVGFKGILNYYFTKSAFLELDYSKYEANQQATRFNAIEERRVRLSVPFKKDNFSGFAKLNLNQLIYKAFEYNQIDMACSAFYGKWNMSTSTILNWIDNRSPFITSMLALAYRIHSGGVFRQTAEYNKNLNGISRYRSEFEKRFANTYFSISYEKNVIAQTDNVFMSLKYDLPYARTGMSAFYSNKTVGFSQNAQGSVALGAGNKEIHYSNGSSLGKGGILFYPFLDLNQNGKRDKGEKMILLNTVKVSGSTAYVSKKDSIVRVSDLNAFVDYHVQFVNTDLDNISWRFKHNNYQIQIDPNQYKKVDVPIECVGEITGMVYFHKKDEKKGLGRVSIHIYDEKGKKVAETLSESDGYYSYLGLKPGKYLVRPDDEQLQKLKFQSSPVKYEIGFKVTEEGEIVEGLDFNIRSIEPFAVLDE